MSSFSRRGVLAGMTSLTTMASAGLAAEEVGQLAAANGPAKPFPLSQVRLRPSIFLDSVEANKRYLLSLDPDRLLHNFHLFAGIAPKGAKYGGWEAQGIAGHSLGHYQSALSLVFAQTGDSRFRDRSLAISRELAAVQAGHGDGYAGATTVDRDGKTVDGKAVFEELRRGDIRTSGFGLNDG